jgi:hypothetical protein
MAPSRGERWSVRLPPARLPDRGAPRQHPLTLTFNFILNLFRETTHVEHRSPPD